METPRGLLRTVIVTLALALCEPRIVSVPPGPLVRVESQPVSIRCQVSDYQGPRDQEFEWHVVLSEERLLPLVSTFDPKFTHSSFRERVSSGEVSGVKLGEAAVELHFRSVRASDSGVYRCSTPSTDSVLSGNYHADVELRVIGDSLKVSPLLPNTSVSSGDPLELQCRVSRGFTEHTFLSVSWLIRRGGAATLEPLLTFGPDDNLTLYGNYVERYRSGGVRLDLHGGGFYGLVLSRSVPQDAGGYVCSAQEWVRPVGEEGSWRKILEKAEEMGNISVKPRDLQFLVSLSLPVTPLSSGEVSELHCKALELLNLLDGRLGVSWTFVPSSGLEGAQKNVSVASMDPDGAMRAAGEYLQRLESGGMVLTRRESNVFTLKLLSTRLEDRGLYSCSISVWRLGAKGEWWVRKEVSSTLLAVQWTPKVPVLSVAAHRVREASAAGSTFEMSCQVVPLHLPSPSSLSVLIRFQGAASSSSRKLLSLSPESVLQLEEWSEPSRIDSVVLEKTGATEYRFRLYGAQLTDRGSYYCEVTAWTRDTSQEWTKGVSSESNKIQIDFIHFGPVFNISIVSEGNGVLLGETARIHCIISILDAAPNTGDLAFDVRWFRSSGASLDNGVAPLVSMDRWGVVKRSGSNHSSLERTEPHTFTLSLHQIEPGDVGEYHCSATPWLLSLATGAWRKESELTSTASFLSARTELWESLKMPVGYGVAAAILAGLLSLLLGFIVARCCFSRNPLHTPRSKPRNKLIDLEMD